MKKKELNPEITVITVTRKRPKLLMRAIESVQKQYLHPLPFHLIIIDDCKLTLEFLKREVHRYRNIIWHFISRDRTETDGVRRLAKLRNIALKIAKTQWIAFLDDDNEYYPDHLTSLLSCVKEKKCKAVYSWRELYWPDGTPFHEHIYPWSGTEEEGRRRYKELVEAGVFQIGSNVARDKADSLDIPNGVRTVDANCWVIERELLLKYPFREEYTEKDIRDMIGDDDKLLLDLLKNGEKIACTKRATVKYYLGGFSNSDRAILNFLKTIKKD